MSDTQEMISDTAIDATVKEQVAGMIDSDNSVLDADESATDIESGQYVTFYVDDECFAFPMQSMREIIRVPKTVAVPLTPAALRGLANLRGTVLPVLDLRCLLNLAETEENDATRVLVTDSGRLSGLIVDRVARVIHVADKQIESAKSVSSSVSKDAIDGVIKGVDGYGLIQLLNAGALIEQEFANIAEHLDSAQGEQMESRQQIHNQDVEDDTTQLVSFVVNEQEYAFEIMQVEEIVRVPENISRIPKSDAHVLGLMDLRGRLLPLVSLRAMFGMPSIAINDDTRVLVVSLGIENGAKQAVGVVVDDIREVLRVTPDVRDQMPGLLAQEDADIETVCRLDDGKRLVSVLNAGRLFDRPDVQMAVNEAEQENGEQEISMSSDGKHEDDHEDQDTQLVVFHLQKQEYGVSIESVQEIIRVPDEMSRVPKTAAFIEGMVNLRGGVLPVLDMRSRFDMQRNERNERQRILVLELDGTRTGFIVDEVNEVLRISKQVIEDAPHLSEDQSRLMGKVVNLSKDDRMIQVLQAAELLDLNEMSALKKAA